MDIDDLEQHDFIDDEYFEKAVEKYSPLIGSFLMNFSYLEHEINIAIAEIINDRTHEIGYTIVERITIKNKIDLFYKMYNRLEGVTDNKTKKILEEIRKDFEEINRFRNIIAHANWQTISKDGSVRIRITVDSMDGAVKIKKANIKPKDIRSKLKEIDKLYNKLIAYTEKALQF